ncbi:DNA-binding response OmpR family regulator [Mucilaginibacter lappiensis]|uniref:DNA-binding response OmpR family regulator n=1 Tax=Mucilaginibacter lappiensis TaxID=354630 RepID=A0ABR6PDF3_9SPHI|nr:response regulator transcription factor [Mucilaginibacter lappiensis]MBB6107769.1 DNA-binding response OmpR family regulator [Mucilaginibacter lappiensis]
MKILYAEDEPFLAHIVSDGLSSSGYAVSVIDDGANVLDAFGRIIPDIVILDIGLPGKDGYMIAAELRARNPQLPIIFLSAKSLPADVVKGFKSGGNDYLKKPFGMEELLIRIEALLHRFGKSGLTADAETRLPFGSCILDVRNQILVTSGAEHSLSYRECSLLRMLIERKNDVLRRQDALMSIWGDDNFYNNRSMDVFMSHIRKMLIDSPEIQIISLRGIGYKLVC